MRVSRLAGTTALFLTLGALTPIAHAVADSGVLYVDSSSTANCSDTSSTAGSTATPYCTVQAAVQAAQPGQTVQIQAGDYSGEVDLTHSGEPGAPITISGADPHNAPMVGQGAAHAFVLNGVHDIVIRQVQTTTSAEQVLVQDSSAVTVDGSDFRTGSGSAPAISISGSSHAVTISRDTITSYAGAAVSLGPGTSDNTVTTNLLWASGDAGISADGSTGNALTSNTVESQEHPVPLVQLTGGATGNTVENNVLQGMTPTAVTVDAQSTAGTTVDYNVVPSGNAPDYTWAGTAYATPTALTAATGQGTHDIAAAVNAFPAENAPTIDSADANAPGELATDVDGDPRVDDPTVANTGTGSGFYDRGAAEFQDPLRLGGVSLNYSQAPTGAPVTATAVVDNPWKDSAAYTFAFGDGSSPVSSSTPSAQHTYTATGHYPVTVSMRSADGRFQASSSPQTVLIDTPQSLTLSTQTDVTDPQAPLTAQTTSDVRSSYQVTGESYDYGDGTSGPSAQHTYQHPGTYTTTTTATDASGATVTATSRVTIGSAYRSTTPTRILDTRSGLGAPQAAVGPGGTISLQITGANGVPAGGVTAAVLNLTATDATAASYVSAYASGTTRTTASALDITPGRTVPAQVTVPVGADGRVTLYNHSGDLQLIADLQGYYQSAPSVPYGAFFAPQQKRVLDTRNGTGSAQAKIGPGGTVTFTVPGQPSVALLNVTATGGTADTYISAYAGGSARTSASVLNPSAGSTVSNLVAVPVGTGSTVTLYNHSGSIDLVADLEGTYATTAGTVLASFTPTAPTRLLDTRDGTGGVAKAPLGPGGTLKLKAPAGSSVLLNLTATGGTAASYLTAYPYGTALPTGSTVNFPAGQTISDAAAVQTSPDGYLALYNHSGYVDVIADQEGYFSG